MLCIQLVYCGCDLKKFIQSPIVRIILISCHLFLVAKNCKWQFHISNIRFLLLNFMDRFETCELKGKSAYVEFFKAILRPLFYCSSEYLSSFYAHVSRVNVVAIAHLVNGLQQSKLNWNRFDSFKLNGKHNYYMSSVTNMKFLFLLCCRRNELGKAFITSWCTIGIQLDLHVWLRTDSHIQSRSITFRYISS